MQETDINKMDFKQLRTKVQELADSLAVMQRKYEDVIYNLDDENFSSKIVKEKADMKTEIQLTADGIKTKVSQTDLAETLVNYSTITQTASDISTAVVNERGNTQSLIEQTADAIYKTIVDERTNTQSLVQQTASSISMRVYKATEQLDYYPTADNTRLDKNTIYFYDGKHYCFDYNLNGGQWVVADPSSLYSAFVLTEDGIAIRGDLIASGSITASAINTEDLYCTRLYAKGWRNNYFARMTSSDGDFGVYKSSASEDDNPIDDSCLFGIYHSDAANQVVNLYSYGNNFLGYNGTQNKTFAKGKWSFGSCTSVDWGNHAPEAVFG